jgi:hypothetical protein
VEFNGAPIDVDITSMQGRTAHRVGILPADIVDRGWVTGNNRIVIHTDYPGNERVEVPVHKIRDRQ